jgi:hypothetical protein
MPYRNDLDAARDRADALESENASLEARVLELENEDRQKRWAFMKKIPWGKIVGTVLVIMIVGTLIVYPSIRCVGKHSMKTKACARICKRDYPKTVSSEVGYISCDPRYKCTCYNRSGYEWLNVFDEDMQPPINISDKDLEPSPEKEAK